MRPILLHSHIRPVTQLKYNREGDLLFSSGKDPSPFVWRTSNGEKLGSYDGHIGAVWCIDVSSDSKRVATGGADAICKVWDAETGITLNNLVCDTSVRTTNFTQDCNTLALSTDAAMGKPCEVRYFDLRDGEQMKDSKPYRTDGPMDRTNKVTSAIFGLFDETFVTGHVNGEITLWCQKTGKKLESEFIHDNVVNDLQKSVDGDYLISGSKDTKAKVMNVRNLEVMREYQTPQSVNSCSFSSSKPFVILGGGQDAQEVTTTDARSGKFVCRFYHKIYETEIGRVKGHFGPINTLASHPDGGSYASGGEDGFIRYHYFDQSYHDFEYSY